MAVASVRRFTPGKGAWHMGVVDSAIIVLLVFLLMILLGLQMQITTTNRDLAGLVEQLRKITEKLDRFRT